MAAKYQMAKKLSARSFGKVRPPFILNADGSIKTYAEGDRKGEQMIANGETKWLYTVFGIATGVREGDTEKGHWVSIQGDFLGVSVENDSKTGEPRRIRAGEFFPPPILTPILKSAVDGRDGGFVEFGFRIGVIGDDTAITNYTYTCEQIMEATESAAVEKLAAKLEGTGQAALEDKSGDALKAAEPAKQEPAQQGKPAQHGARKSA